MASIASPEDVIALISRHPLPLAGTALILAALLLGVLQSFTSKNPPKRSPASTSTVSSWESFVTPVPEPDLDFDPVARTPKLYRPFRHGRNFITMGIRKMDWNNWIEMDSYFLQYHETKAAELKKDFDEHIKHVDNEVTKHACFELYEELVQYLVHRYPKVFRLSANTVHNALTGETFRFPAQTPFEAPSSSALLVQDDLVIMVENDDGHYHLDAGAVCLPGFWRLREKFRMWLDTLHFEASVPHYAEKLQKSMNRFFKTLPAARPVVRNNYFILLDDGLHWSHRLGDQAGTEVASWATANSKGLTIDEIHFPVRTPIVTEPHVPGRLAEAIRNWDETMSKYKGKSHREHILLPYLDGQHRLQKESGVLESQTDGEFPF
ncbi:heme-dependent oxidative N-demethylase family protein [Aspergillus foveolatus]|uniref:heme-dependent oxidative N-demethylase family protein n=1 Tax=Aspergillus foveolatus TaxID=210207 RepID=UPI003CCCA0F2